MRNITNAAPFRVLFFGNDNFSVASLKALRNADKNLVKNVEVVTNKSKQANEVKSYAEQNGMKFYDWPPQIELNEYDLGVASSFGHLIPNQMIKAFEWGILNVHASLLPRWQGSSPITYSILNGDHITGVTIMQIKPHKFDGGNIMLQDECEITSAIRTPELADQLANMGSSLLIKCLGHLDYYSANCKPQDPMLVTRAPKLIPSMGHIDWTQCTTSKLDRMFRALSHAVPIYTFWKGTKVKLLNVKLCPDLDPSHLQGVPSDAKFGYAFYHKRRKTVLIKCLDGWVGVDQFAVAAKKAMSAADLQNGFLSKVERHFCYFE